MRKTYSGKFVLRIPSAMHEALSLDAKKRGLSLNDLCCENLFGNANTEWRFRDTVNLAQAIAGTHFIGCILIGSFARQTATTQSDVDILVVVNEGFKHSREQIRRWDDAELKVDGKPVSATFIKIAEEEIPENVLWLEAAIDGQIVYDHAGTLFSILRRIRQAIADKSIHRRYSHGQPYWVRG